MDNEKLKSLLESTDGLTDDFKSAVAPIFEEALADGIQEVKELYEGKLAEKETELSEQAQSHLSELEALNEKVEEMVSEGVQEKLSDLNDKINYYLEYVVEEFVKKHEDTLLKMESAKVADGFMRDLGALYEKYNIEKPESSKALEEELSKTKSELSESYETIYDLVNTRDELEAKVEGFERANILATVAEEKNLSESEVSKLQSIIEGFSGTQDDFKSKAVEIAESFAEDSDDKVVTEGAVVSEQTPPIMEEVSLKKTAHPEVDAIAEQLIRFNRK